MSTATKLKQQHDVRQNSAPADTVQECDRPSPALEAITELYAEVEEELLYAQRNLGRSTAVRMTFVGLAMVCGVIAFRMPTIGWFVGTVGCVAAVLIAHIAVLNFAIEVAALEATLRRAPSRRARGL